MESNIYEFSLQPQKLKLQKTLAIVFNVLSIIYLVLVVFFVALWWFEIALMFFINMILAMLLRNCFYIFYDYTYVDGDFRIFKLVNNKYRKKVEIFDSRNVISIGKIGGETYNNCNKDGVTRKKYAKNRFKLKQTDIVVLLQKQDKQILLILEHDIKYTSYLIKKAGVKKLDKDLIAYIKEGGLQINE